MILDRIADEAVENATEHRRSDGGGHDGFFFLDGLSRAKLLDVHETACETENRARKLVLACEKRIETSFGNGNNGRGPRSCVSGSTLHVTD